MWRPARTCNRVDAARPMLLGLAIVSAGCARPAPRPTTTPPATPAVDARVARVSLGTVPTAALWASAAWRLIAAEGDVVARGDSGARVSLTTVRGALRVTEPGQPAREVSSPLSLTVANGHGAAVFNGRRYRGELSVTAA